MVALLRHRWLILPQSSPFEDQTRRYLRRRAVRFSGAVLEESRVTMSTKRGIETKGSVVVSEDWANIYTVYPDIRSAARAR